MFSIRPSLSASYTRPPARRLCLLPLCGVFYFNLFSIPCLPWPCLPHTYHHTHTHTHTSQGQHSNLLPRCCLPLGSHTLLTALHTICLVLHHTHTPHCPLPGYRHRPGCLPTTITHTHTQCHVHLHLAPHYTLPTPHTVPHCGYLPFFLLPTTTTHRTNMPQDSSPGHAWEHLPLYSCSSFLHAGRLHHTRTHACPRNGRSSYGAAPLMPRAFRTYHSRISITTGLHALQHAWRMRSGYRTKSCGVHRISAHHCADHIYVWRTLRL